MIRAPARSSESCSTVAAYAVVRSKGWSGDTLVLEGDVQRGEGPCACANHQADRADEFEAVWEAFRDGAWSAYAIERLTRRV